MRIGTHNNLSSLEQKIAFISEILDKLKDSASKSNTENDRKEIYKTLEHIMRLFESKAAPFSKENNNKFREILNLLDKTSTIQHNDIINIQPEKSDILSEKEFDTSDLSESNNKEGSDVSKFIRRDSEERNSVSGLSESNNTPFLDLNSIAFKSRNQDEAIFKNSPLATSNLSILQSSLNCRSITKAVIIFACVVALGVLFINIISKGEVNSGREF